ncbi:hypothetical protein ACFC18_03365 [Streptomyces sp. NPDC056121]|uniref:hypothetical protein n=1 Tax=Streptomyces TaxID=1883 RepID=UPI001D09DB1A|nr:MULTISPECIES: hypothetical protein [Streptomyces]MCX5081285.1 hypothetical protein [Streptomyces sp. NBC_00401]UDL99478.1 hypothetical protein LGI35_14915 [Streptomyces longhuiensis]
MRIRRILPAVIATAALAGLGLTGAASATAAAHGASTYVTPSQCKQGGGMPDLMDNLCKGGMHNGESID